MDAAEQAPEHDQPRIEDVHEASQPEPEPAADVVERFDCHCGPTLGLEQDRVELAAATGGVVARALEQGVCTHFGLPAADGSAATRCPGRVHRDVPDLAAVTSRSADRLAADDQPAADADLARDEQH